MSAPERGSVSAVSLNPKMTCLLGDVLISKDEKKPLGGLNPYNPHFDRIGTQFHRLLIEHAGLKKHHHILDIGCGTGRLTKPLTTFLEDGIYDGFDVNNRFLNYCRDNYKTPNFTFTHCDVKHEEFNPTGTIDPQTFEFPYPDKTFDVVTAIAVFNHFHTSWVFQYVREISRVIKPRGIFLGTILLLNRQSMEYINTRKTQPYLFPLRTPESWHDFEQRPLWNVAQPEEGIRRVFIKSNLMLKEPIRYGEWCLSKIALSGPDVILARKGGWGN